MSSAMFSGSSWVKDCMWVCLLSLPVSKVQMQKMFLASCLIMPTTKIVDKLKWDLLLSAYQPEDEIASCEQTILQAICMEIRYFLKHFKLLYYS